MPLTAGGGLFAFAMISRWGRRSLAAQFVTRTLPVAQFLARNDV